jgi:hypothetical protein
VGGVDCCLGELEPRVEILEEGRREYGSFQIWDGNWKRSTDDLMMEMGMILGNHQQEIVEMKNVLEAQTRTILVQNTMIQGLSVQVQNLQQAVDPVG